MARAPKLYTRLTRNSSGVGTVASLWLGPDHLLLIRSTGYTENYARVQFRDIKGIFLTAGERRRVWGLIWGVLGGISGLIMVTALVGHETPIASAIFFGVGLVAFVWNHLLGPGCGVFVVTQVQTLALPALVRRNKAQRILAQLQPLIEAAQAGLVPAPPPAPAAPPPAAAPGESPAPNEPSASPAPIEAPAPAEGASPPVG